MKVQTFLPVFNGFYNTFFENIIDNAVDNQIEYYNEQNSTKLIYDDFNFDFDSIMQEICKDAVSKIEEKLNEMGMDCSIIYKNLVSPREYNFANDSINMKLISKNLAELLKSWSKIMIHLRNILKIIIHPEMVLSQAIQDIQAIGWKI